MATRLMFRSVKHKKRKVTNTKGWTRQNRINSGIENIIYEFELVLGNQFIDLFFLNIDNHELIIVLYFVVIFKKIAENYTENFSEHIGRVWNSFQVLQKKTF